MTYTIGIVAHPARAGRAMRLANTIHASVVSLDNDGAGGKVNHLRTLRLLAETHADWLVVLEDDAMPCRDFHTHLEAALADAPSDIISLYLGTGRWAGTVPSMHEPKVRALIKQADQDGSPWIVGGMWHAVAYAIKTDAAREAINDIDVIPAPIDQAISIWAKRTGRTIHYTWPSHVDHHDEQRLVNAPEAPVNRRAWQVCDARL